jgi:three-Cys-motif partner protein
MVAGYLKAFTTALQDKPTPRRPFQLWYIDAFAGTGERTVRLTAKDANLLESLVEERLESRRGSAQIAIDTKPPFDRLIFIEQKKRHVVALQELAAKYPERSITVLKGDANRRIQGGTRAQDWSGVRAVMFLDPYGMGVEWETLEAIRKTKAIDVWYLVSLSGLYRQATRRKSDLDEKKRAALTRMLGTNEWETAWYDQGAQTSLLEEFEPEERRTGDLGRLEAFVTKRLKSLFPTVLGPKRLFNDRNAPMFSLYFLCSNPSPRARGVAERIANHILKGSSSHVRPR